MYAFDYYLHEDSGNQEKKEHLYSFVENKYHRMMINANDAIQHRIASRIVDGL